MIFDVTKENFKEEVLNSKIPVLVDFSAEWCGPCQMALPILEKIANDYVSKLKVCRVDSDKNIELCAEYKVLSIPNFILFKDGKIAKQMAGYTSEEDFLEFLEL